MPGKLSKADWEGEKIMPIKKIDLDPSDLVENRNFMMWVNRELKIFRSEPVLQMAVAENLDKVTTLPLKELHEAMSSGY